MSGSFDHSAARHLFRRAGFGADRERLARAVASGLDETLDELFAAREHDPDLERGERALLGLESIEPLQSSWFARILADTAPLVERVALMWHGHFATSWDKVRDARLMHAQVQLFRERGLGDFRALLHAVATDPAMLLWLDGDRNERGQPNENFAREVMELFGLGRGQYGERDIQEAARAFTGWGVDRRRFVVRERDHDPGPKSVLGTTGALDGHDVIDLVLAHPACARHVARRLLVEFVVPEPTDAEIDAWAAQVVADDWQIERALARLFRSDLFLSSRARRSRIAAPVELVAITARVLDAHPTPQQAARAAARMGQALYRPPSVEGWIGGRRWIHAGTWLERHNALTKLAASHATDDAFVDLARAFDHPAPDKVVGRAVDVLLDGDVDAAFVRVLEDARAAAADPDAALRAVTALILTAPDYHLV